MTNSKALLSLAFFSYCSAALGVQSSRRGTGAGSGSSVSDRAVGNSVGDHVFRGSSVGITTVAGAGGSKGNGKLEANMGSMVTGMLVGQGGVTESLEASMANMITNMLTGRGATLRHIVEAADAKMDINEAVNRLEGKLPGDVEELVKLASTGVKNVAASMRARGQAFDESALQKARKILNGMIERAWVDLDRVLLSCKEFKEMNRQTFSQVTTDIARLGSQAANLERKKATANMDIADKNSRFNNLQTQLSKKLQEFNAKRAENRAELTMRQNELAVFTFIINMTRCKGEDASLGLMQVQGAGSEAAPVSVCKDNDGLELVFDNPHVQAQFEKMMTPAARSAVREALGQSDDTAVSLLKVHQGQPRTTTGTTKTQKTYTIRTTKTIRTGGMTKTMKTMMRRMRKRKMKSLLTTPSPVAEEPKGEQWKKCSDEKPHCGLLHDMMASQWGKYKDLVDELQAQMDQSSDEYHREKENLNDQLSIVGGGKKHMMEQLAETISDLNLDNQERSQKDEEYRLLEKEFRAETAKCRSQVEEILFTNMCAVRKVRNAIMKDSKVSPPANITDCDVKDWVAGECSKDCDDSCPNADPTMCGGEQMLTRTVIVAANANGVRCPELTKTKKCNQFKCPVDCVMSKWSGWSKCSKECESGIQSKTRSILTKPRNGGETCDATSEERVCNTGSCDRDCKLSQWSGWSPCSVACGGGEQNRKKKVARPIRGQGKCPTEKNGARYQSKSCNKQPCNNDEVCVAKQDLLILLDASGSLRESGFEVMRSFAGNLTKRFKSKHLGAAAMRVGVILFGNGRLLPDGSTQSATNVVGLTSDMDAVRAAIAGTTWQRGFTNMAQAFALADTMLQSGRADAQSAVLVLSDGKYSFEYETKQKVKDLKDKNVQIFMAPVCEFTGSKEIKKMKTWASSPWQTNYERIPGIAALKVNQEAFAGKLVSKFCSDAISPSETKSVVEAKQYMMIKEGGMPNPACARPGVVGKVSSVEACYDAARSRGVNAFNYCSKDMMKGMCMVEGMQFDRDWYTKHTGAQDEIPCPGGDWINNPYFDTYAVEPTPAK
mmetsp:Transcript_136131/g.271529  ORF Transcript_136131/g.271529 Transcript_136131/m.271529 type:complete len:1062 (+) Transcript_136131:111-3296(+)